MDSGPVCHEFESSTAEDPLCGRADAQNALNPLVGGSTRTVYCTPTNPFPLVTNAASMNVMESHNPLLRMF
ncbi:hypothetical protein TNCV_3910181 [Trichonephila clavipes]|nr:hypothetical protein TNCV_3910181 [Trichonephila clavipes]